MIEDPATHTHIRIHTKATAGTKQHYSHTERENTASVMRNRDD